MSEGRSQTEKAKSKVTVCLLYVEGFEREDKEDLEGFVDRCSFQTSVLEMENYGWSQG